VSRLRRPFLSDRFFFVTVRVLERRSELRVADFHLLALAFRRARPASILFDRLGVPSRPAAAEHAVCAPVYPLTKNPDLTAPAHWASSKGEPTRRRLESCLRGPKGTHGSTSLTAPSVLRGKGCPYNVIRAR
jgi:hypothetical protein